MNKIYILMATYNGEKYLQEQIDSLLNQTYQNWVLWIHDDNSKDKTVEIIEKYQNKYPDKISFIHDDISTGGAKENFTYLLYKIDNNFDYVMFCDQDDVWLEKKIEVTLNKMKEIENNNINKPILIHTDLMVVDEKLNVIADSMFRYQKLSLNNQKNIKLIAMENIVTGCTMMLNKKLAILSQNIPDEAIMHDWWIAIITLKEKGIIGFVNESTILYRQHALNTIGSKRVNLLYYLKKIFTVKKSFDRYQAIYCQYKKAGVDINPLHYTITKTLIVTKKVTLNES